MTHSDFERQLWEQGEWEHLPYPILQDYVNGSLDEIDREVVEGHFAICESCVAEARLLRAERDALLSEPHRTVSSARKPLWWLPVISGLAGAVVAAGGLWLFVVRPQRQQVHALTVAQRTAMRLSNQQAAELEALRQKITHPAPSPTPIALVKLVPSAKPIKVAQAEHLTLPDLAYLQSHSVLRSPNNTSLSTFALLSPKGTRVRGSSPTLRWQAVAGAHQYEVVIAQSNDTIFLQKRTTKTALRVEHPLPKGEPLLWEVHALDAEGKELGVALEGCFEQLTEAQEAHLSHALATAPTALSRTKALAQAGVFDEAVTVLRSQKSPLAQTWLRTLQSARGNR